MSALMFKNIFGSCFCLSTSFTRAISFTLPDVGHDDHVDVFLFLTFPCSPAHLFHTHTLLCSVVSMTAAGFWYALPTGVREGLAFVGRFVMIDVGRMVGCRVY